ncbi:hypothetical protein FHR24_003105 [Wenyingzhuangia heitensis]|uniref:Uncharacterized protein n=1 Tax=Wenyingzhuangia heitensis TaxID=1487859 RepID=A0ABX0UFF9_9FLAO|nr:hypothetical protein [Wenyingzhuangia heitensis]NIJ46615.1 hypothetical protein [Wenyingzhuangia heitensis]
MKTKLTLLLLFLLLKVNAQKIKIDTILNFENYTISINKIDSNLEREKSTFEIEMKDVLSKEDNMHRKSLLKETYLIKKNKNIAKKELGNLFLKTENNGWKKIELNPISEEIENVLDNVYLTENLYVVRTQWGEGNGYKLVNKINGEITDSFGEPRLNKEGNFIISFNVDLVAEYTENGFEFFTNNKSINYIGKFNPKNWGAEWGVYTSENKFIFKCYSVDDYLNQNHFYIQAEIKKR